jgi:hypothetical protein
VLGTQNAVTCQIAVLPEFENPVTIFQEVDDFGVAQHL